MLGIWEGMSKDRYRDFLFRMILKIIIYIKNSINGYKFFSNLDLFWFRDIESLLKGLLKF